MEIEDTACPSDTSQFLCDHSHGGLHYSLQCPWKCFWWPTFNLTLYLFCMISAWCSLDFHTFIWPTCLNKWMHKSGWAYIFSWIYMALWWWSLAQKTNGSTSVIALSTEIIILDGSQMICTHGKAGCCILSKFLPDLLGLIWPSLSWLLFHYPLPA